MAVPEHIQKALSEMKAGHENAIAFVDAMFDRVELTEAPASLEAFVSLLFASNVGTIRKVDNRSLMLIMSLACIAFHDRVLRSAQQSIDSHADWERIRERIKVLIRNDVVAATIFDQLNQLFRSDESNEDKALNVMTWLCVEQFCFSQFIPAATREQ